MMLKKSNISGGKQNYFECRLLGRLLRRCGTLFNQIFQLQPSHIVLLEVPVVPYNLS